MCLNTSFRAIIYLPHSLGPSFLSGAFQAAGRIHSRLSFPTITSPESWYEDSTRPVKFFFFFWEVWDTVYPSSIQQSFESKCFKHIFGSAKKKVTKLSPKKVEHLHFLFRKKMLPSSLRMASSRCFFRDPTHLCNVT